MKDFASTGVYFRYGVIPNDSLEQIVFCESIQEPSQVGSLHVIIHIERFSDGSCLG